MYKTQIRGDDVSKLTYKSKYYTLSDEEIRKLIKEIEKENRNAWDEDVEQEHDGCGT